MRHSRSSVYATKLLTLGTQNRTLWYGTADCMDEYQIAARRARLAGTVVSGLLSRSIQTLAFKMLN